MPELSPAAQAVMDAATNGNTNVVNDPVYKQCIAAALRAAADQVVPQANYYMDSPWSVGFADRDAQLRRDLLAIATELSPDADHD